MTTDFAGAQGDAQQPVGGLVDDGRARAEVHHNAYRAALECHDWAAALRELISAAKLDARRFAPFPMGKYLPQRIVGAGGLGVAFLCKHKLTGAPLLVRTLSADDLDRGIDTAFTEAQALQQLDHPNITRLHDCGFTDPAARARPYLVREYFDGVTLEEYVQTNGPLPPADALAVAQGLAQALEAAHRKGILHRNVKPSHLLLRKDTRPDGTAVWAVKVIDFGLTLRQDRILGSSTAPKTLLGASIAHTSDYAAPEQMGKRPDMPVGPPTDVYGWARTCCFALFGTPHPLPRHWARLPTALTRFLEDCLEEDPNQRPRSFMALCKRLATVTATVTGSAAPVAVAPVGVTTAQAGPVGRTSSAIRRASWDEGGEGRYAEEGGDYHQASRHRLFWVAGGIAAGAATLVVVLLVVLLWRDRQPPQAPAPVAQGASSTPVDRAPAWQPPVAEDAPPPVARAVRPRTLPEEVRPMPQGPLPHREAVARSKAPTPDEAASQSLAELKSDSAARRRAALLRLVRLRGVVEREDVAPAAVKLLKDSDKNVRQAAARAVGAWGGPDQVNALARLLNDPDASIRRAGIAALGHLKTEKAAEPLMRHLMVEFEPSLEALRELGPLAEPAAMARLKDSDHKVRVEACKVLIYVFTVKSGPDLKSLSRDVRDRDLQAIAQAALKHDQAVMVALAHLTRTDAFAHFHRIEAAKALANLAPNARRAQVAEALVHQLSQGDPFLNDAIPNALATWGTPEVVPNLIQMLNQEDQWGRVALGAISALGRLKDPRAVDALAPRLVAHGFVETRAQQALVSLGEVAEWPLQKYLTDSDPAMRAAVCEVLGKIGTDDSIPALEALTTDGEDRVAGAASRAIEAINRRAQ